MSETVFQFPPLRVNFPLPIRVRISSGVSLGPLANGVYLGKSPPSLGIASGLHPGARGGEGWGTVSPPSDGVLPRVALPPPGGAPKGRAMSLSSGLPEAGLSFSHQTSTTPATLGLEEGAGG